MHVKHMLVEPHAPARRKRTATAKSTTCGSCAGACSLQLEDAHTHACRTLRALLLVTHKNPPTETHPQERLLCHATGHWQVATIITKLRLQTCGQHNGYHLLLIGLVKAIA